MEHFSLWEMRRPTWVRGQSVHTSCTAPCIPLRIFLSPVSCTIAALTTVVREARLLCDPVARLIEVWNEKKTWLRVHRNTDVLQFLNVSVLDQCIRPWIQPSSEISKHPDEMSYDVIVSTKNMATTVFGLSPFRFIFCLVKTPRDSWILLKPCLFYPQTS